MRVTIVTRACEFILKVTPKESILEIKHKIEQFLGVPITTQTLTVSGWELVDGLDLEDYPIINESTRIDLTVRSTHISLEQQHDKINIIVKFSSRKLNIEVDTTETVRSLKEKIHIIDGTPIKRMCLFFSGTELEEDYRNLSEYGICDFSEIIVFLKTMSRFMAEPPSKKLSLTVQTASCLLNGARIPVEMKDINTVSDLRQFMLIRKMLPMDDYIFIQKQRIMRDNCSLRWHGVEDGECLHVFKGTVSRGELQ